MDTISQSPVAPTTPITMISAMPGTPATPLSRQQSFVPKSTPTIEKIIASEPAATPVPTTPSVGGDDSNDASQPPLTLTPRQSGSMVTHHDDVVTRMKNIEMIELGKHRIKPWYFAPYPQVNASVNLIQSEMAFPLQWNHKSI